MKSAPDACLDFLEFNDPHPADNLNCASGGPAGSERVTIKGVALGEGEGDGLGLGVSEGVADGVGDGLAATTGSLTLTLTKVTAGEVPETESVASVSLNLK